MAPPAPTARLTFHEMTLGDLDECDCGLTPQQVDGRTYVEVGYHVMPSWQGQGLATEAAGACRLSAVERLGLDYLIAIIDPNNKPCVGNHDYRTRPPCVTYPGDPRDTAR